MLVVSAYVLFWPDPAGAGSGLPGADKVVHALLFAALALTAARRFGLQARVLLAVLTYAAASEVVQAAVLTQRSGDGWDVVADVVGAVLGWSLARRR